MSFKELSDLVGKLNISDDVIVMDRKIRDLADYFRQVFDNEETLKQVFQHFNELALKDDKFAINCVLFFSSRTIETVFQMGNKVRDEMLNILQQNFMNVDTLKQRNPVHFYNSVTLLGEYYNRVRVAGSPMNILGQSLIQLLTDHLREDIAKHLNDSQHVLDERFANLVLTQITLNGSLARPHHKVEIEGLLFEVRRCLILFNNLSSTTKALLYMTIDLYSSNFTHVGQQLENLYNSYLITQQPAVSSNGSKDDKPAEAPKPTIRSISAISMELSQMDSGLQRPHINVFVKRPLKASERLQFVRDQCKASSDSAKDVKPEVQTPTIPISAIAIKELESASRTRGIAKRPLKPCDRLKFVRDQNKAASNYAKDIKPEVQTSTIPISAITELESASRTQEIVKQPLKPSDRLKFVRDQCKATSTIPNRAIRTELEQSSRTQEIIQKRPLKPSDRLQFVRDQCKAASFIPNSGINTKLEPASGTQEIIQKRPLKPSDRLKFVRDQCSYTKSNNQNNILKV